MYIWELPDDVVGIIVDLLPLAGAIALQSTCHFLRLAICNHIMSLEFHQAALGKKLTVSQQINIAACFPNLRSVTLYNWHIDCTDQHLQRLAQLCPLLQTFQVHAVQGDTMRCGIGDAGMQALAKGCVNLREIIIQGRTEVRALLYYFVYRILNTYSDKRWISERTRAILSKTTTFKVCFTSEVY